MSAFCMFFILFCPTCNTFETEVRRLNKHSKAHADNPALITD